MKRIVANILWTIWNSWQTIAGSLLMAIVYLDALESRQRVRTENRRHIDEDGGKKGWHLALEKVILGK